MPTDRPVRKPRPLRRAVVQRTERLTPHMIRVILGGPGLADFAADEYTDHYVKLVFPQPDVEYPQPLNLEQIRSDLPREQWPSTRTYTVRSFDAQRAELAIDFVYHGDEGLAGPWAARAQPGDELHFTGPGGGYAPSIDADWHLLAGDESALPAIAAALERLPVGAPAFAFIEVDGPQDEQQLDTHGAADIRWIHRSGRPVGAGLVEAVRALEFPAGKLQAFVHGEATFVKDLRRLLRVEHSIAADQLSISGYWRLGVNEDGWQASKSDWNRKVLEEQESAPVA